MFTNILIKTKLSRPGIPEKAVQRPRLISRLEEGLKKRVTLISAPAGYGKTTLAAQWLESRPVAWVSLDSSDSEPERFLRYFIEAIKSLVPGFGDRILPLLTSPTLPPPDYLANTMISELSVTEKPLLLVLDDYHTIADESVGEILTRMIQHRPENLHMVIITRHDPAWPLSLWRSRGWVNELRAADLCFSGDEARAFLNPDSKKNISDKTSDMLQRRTEGWVAGLQMARLSMTHADNPEAFAMSFSGSDRMIVDFLIDEVISSQPPEIFNFLVVTALFERFCASLCDHLFADEPDNCDSRNLIGLLKKENLFLVPLDNEGVWYRYHHLFQSLLARKMRTVLPDERKTRLHRRAGEWFSGRTLIEEAITHLIAAGDVDGAAKQIAENLHTVLEKDWSRRTLLRWLKIFPKDAEKEHPVLLAAYACCKMFHWDFQGLRPLMEKAETLLQKPFPNVSESMRRILQGYVHVQSGFYFYWQGDTESALRHARQAIRNVPRHHSWAYNGAVLYAAGSLAAMGRREESLQLLSQTLKEDFSDNSRNFGMILAARMVIHCYEGKLDSVREVAEQVLESHKTVPVSEFWLSHAYYFLGSVAYERNFPNIAAEYFGRVEQMLYRVNTRFYNDCLIGLALVALARGEMAKAREYADRARSFAIEMNDLFSRQMSDSFHTRLSMLSGEIPVEPALFPSSIDSNKFWLEIPGLTRAEYLIRTSAPDCRDALSVIEDGLKAAKDFHNHRQVIQFLAVKAVALKYAGKIERAFEVLEETLAMAEPLGFVRTFVDRGPVMAEMLEELVNNSSLPHYINHLLGAFGQVNPPYESLLTRRELDVLKMLAKRLTYREIAENLFISPETVKSHAARIYRKLKVSGRAQAIDAAKKCGLLLERNI